MIFKVYRSHLIIILNVHVDINKYIEFVQKEITREKKIKLNLFKQNHVQFEKI